jgi:hypothetical protein
MVGTITRETKRKGQIKAKRNEQLARIFKKGKS